MRAMIFAAAVIGTMAGGAEAQDQSETLRSVASRCLNPVFGADAATARTLVEIDASGQVSNVSVQNAEDFGNLGSSVSVAIQRAFSRCAPYHVDSGKYEVQIPLNS